MAERPKKKPRRYLNYDKCQNCRRDKKACNPVGRIWPQKCQRCIDLELECSENSRAAGAPPLTLNRTLGRADEGAGLRQLHDLHDFSLRVTWLRRLKRYQETVETTIKAQNKLSDQSRFPPEIWSLRDFISEEEQSIYGRLLQGTLSGDPLVGLAALSFNAEVVSLRDHPLFPQHTAGAGAMVDCLLDNGNISAALLMQEMILMDKCKKRDRGIITSGELQKYFNIYSQTTERLRFITGRNIPMVPPLHNLLLLTQGSAMLPFDMTQACLQDPIGRSLFHLALDLGFTEDILLLTKFDVLGTVSQDALGRLPIHVACISSKAVVKYFLDGKIRPDVIDLYQNSPLHYAAANGNLDAVKALLGQSANVNSKTKHGYTPLHRAIEDINVVRLLLDKGADINSKTEDGNTPLHRAVKDVNVVRLLLEKGADINSKTKNGNTPLYLAILGNHTETVQLLLEKGADINFGIEDNETLLHLAARRNYTETVRLLLEKGANINIRTEENNTPLHLAVERNHIETVQLLLEKGADINARTKESYTPLHLAVDRNHTETAQLLLEKGANINSKTKKGHTPLHWAALHDCTESVRLLLEKDADITSEDINGNTALSLAIRYQCSDTIWMLRKKAKSQTTTSRSPSTALKWNRRHLSGRFP